jgi:hypothetical protein
MFNVAIMVSGMHGMFCVVLALVSLGGQALSPSTQDDSTVLHLGNTSQGLRGASSSQVGVAIVGSGPISESDRDLIRNAREIYRFNSMNNLRKDEKVGTVFLRRGHNMECLVSGLPPNPGACPLIKHADALRIIMDPGPPMDPLCVKDLKTGWPSVEVIEESPQGMLEIDGEEFRCTFANGNPNPGGFSSGFVGVAYVLKHSRLVMQGQKVHIFGMNWKHTSAHSGRHPWWMEEDALANAKSVVIHPTSADTYKPRNKWGGDLMTCEGAV